MPKLLLVDDEADITALIRRYAERDGYTVETASDGTEAVLLCEASDFDAIVMDVMMPDMDGFFACKKIKEKKDIPVLMLSARGTEYDKLYGFEVGVDDYMTKPFSVKELMARLGVIIRRHKASTAEPARPTLAADGLVLDLAGRTATIDGTPVDLTTKEFDLLCTLLQNRGIVLSRQKLLDTIWGYDYFGEDRTVDWQIKLLRAKLGAYRDRIKTIRGVGYKFE